MPKVEKAVIVKAPVSAVFKYVDEPTHLPEIWPSLFEVKDVEILPDGTRRFAWLYNMAGHRFAGKTETLEHVENERIVEQAKGEIESTFTWRFQGENGTTKVAFEADYTLPAGTDEKFARFLEKRNALELDVLLENLKARLEI